VRQSGARFCDERIEGPMQLRKLRHDLGKLDGGFVRAYRIRGSAARRVSRRT
jgi:hypothetical protein